MFMPGEIREDKPWRRGTFKAVQNESQQVVVVRLDGDPFDVCVYAQQIRPATAKESTEMPKSATKEKPKAKELRRQAKALGVTGWEDMSLAELEEAVEEAQAEQAKPAKKTAAKKASKKASAVDEDDDDDDDDDDEDDDDEDDDDEDDAPAKSSKKSSSKSKASKTAKASKKAPAKKAATKAATRERVVNENGNPYQPGTNLYHMAEALIKGGKVASLVKQVGKKVSINARTRDYDEDSEREELQRRLIIVSQRLRNDFGFTMEKEGRGADATIKCIPPS
jgi:hypothetical protein